MIYHFIHFHLKEHSFESIQLNFQVKILKNNKVINIQVKKKMKIDKIANGPEYRMNEQLQNLLIFGILIIFQTKKKI